ncbi:TPA: hypothetical protein ACY4P8_000917 [Vibrio parahaemolyticus]|nr:hypothetical protein [Vibrio parahaemolyticus]
MTAVFLTQETQEDKVIDANEFLDSCEEQEYFQFRTAIAKNRKTEKQKNKPIGSL